MDARLKISFIIPVLNGGVHLPGCLGSITGQDYPQDLIEIIVADAGSTDSSPRIAAGYGARIIPNPKRLAEYGLQTGIDHSTGDIIVIFAADNELHSREWIKTVAGTFEDFPECSAVWGPLKSGPDDGAINRYFELIQSDPMTFFMNKNMRRYINDRDTISHNGRLLFRVSPERPLVWGANGLAMRRKTIAPIWAQEGYLGDNDAFQRMVEEGNNLVAYIPGHITYHHHVGAVGDWVRKWRRNFVSHFLSNLGTRNTNWVFTSNFRPKLVLWALYSGVPVISGIHSLYMCARDRNIHWAYHPLLSFLQTAVYAYFIVSTPKGRDTILKIAKGEVLGKAA